MKKTFTVLNVFILSLCHFAYSNDKPDPVINYTISCSLGTDICNTTGFPPDLIVTPSGALNYDFYIYSQFGPQLMQSGTSNVLPVNYSSSKYYCVVTDNSGNYQTDDIQLRIIFSPHWWIASNILTLPVCVNALLQFQPAVWDTYQWYKNGVPITGATSSDYIATSDGTYNCIVSNSCGSDSAQYGQYLTVDPQLPANPVISVNPGTTLCVGPPVTLTAPAVPGCLYKWYKYYGNGSFTNFNTGVDHDTITQGSLMSAGSLKYLVIMENACGTKNSEVTLLWTQDINASLSASGPLQFCPGNTVTLTATQNPAWTYQWQKNNLNISGGNSNAYTINSTGSYRLNISNASGCTNTFLANVSATGPDASTSGTTPFCTNTQEYVFTPEGIGFTYQWLKNGALLAGATNDSLAVDSVTNGSYRVIVTSGCGTDTSAAVQYAFNSPPTVSISSSGPLNFCKGDSVELQANYGLNYSYLWSNNGASIPGGDLIHFTAKTTGFYNVVVRNPIGCTVAGSGIQVNVFNKPVPVVSPNGPLIFCSGNNVLLSSTTGAGASYQWKKNGTPIPGATASSYLAEATGNYKVVKTNSNGCTGTSSVTTVTIKSLPDATLSPQGPTTFCLGDSVQLKATFNNTYSYLWKKNNVTIGGAATNKYIAKTQGNYKVKVTNSKGCINISVPLSVTVPCRMEAASTVDGFNSNFQVYPNPSTGIFTLHFDHVTSFPLLVQITDMFGKVIDRMEVYEESAGINISGQREGIYSVIARNKEQVITKKITIIK